MTHKHEFTHFYCATLCSYDFARNELSSHEVVDVYLALTTKQSPCHMPGQICNDLDVPSGLGDAEFLCVAEGSWQAFPTM